MFCQGTAGHLIPFPKPVGVISYSLSRFEQDYTVYIKNKCPRSVRHSTNELEHDKITCAPSEDLKSAWASAWSTLCAHWVAKGPMFLHAAQDETGWMPRLIRVFAGRTGHFVDFVVLRLKSCFRQLTCWPIWVRSCEYVFYAICKQQRCRSTCASAQSDQHLCCSLPR